MNRICPLCHQVVTQRDHEIRNVTVGAVWGPSVGAAHWQHLRCPTDRHGAAYADPPPIPTHVVGRCVDGRFVEWLSETYDDPMTLSLQEMNRLMRDWDAGWRPQGF